MAMPIPTPALLIVSDRNDDSMALCATWDGNVVQEDFTKGTYQGGISRRQTMAMGFIRFSGLQRTPPMR
ncbi:hypothetical protein [Streptomyces humicola]|uniref:hypothetical protein n=1 Tax=Streptomyces humicola TaxID=2953240 RepID=UPI00210C569F|nr:hypothetical protein [Streptomyces humicola]